MKVTGRGMRKPRKKRVKRSKSKGKSPKTTSRPSQKEESEPERVRKMARSKEICKKDATLGSNRKDSRQFRKNMPY